MKSSIDNSPSANSETDVDALFASPSKNDQRPSNESTPSEKTILPIHTRQAGAGGRFDDEETRQAGLQAELEGIRNINRVIEGVVDSLDRAKQNMEMVSRTVTSSATLLNTWTRILSQTEHNQRLILNPAWQGAGRDIADLEEESLLRKREAERRELEEQQRREAAARKAEEEQEQRRQAESSTGRGTRAFKSRVGRGVGRGALTTVSASRGVGGQTTRGVGRGGTTSTRGSSVSGRGTATGIRGRGRANR
ncbi:MAG: hypothetical protein M1816_001540 [Peltula sp. TS41687]|nr:MAG: hypothetical protein M1816_001540 [Peltula sp. TS41687]